MHDFHAHRFLASMASWRFIPSESDWEVVAIHAKCSHLLTVLVCCAGLVGCSPEGNSRSQSRDRKDDPPVPTAAAQTEHPRITSEEVHRRLKKKNPEYASNAQIGIDDQGEIYGVSLRDTNVTDLTSLEGLRLKMLDLYGLSISDLHPLEQLPLHTLMLENSQVSDLSPLRGMPLRELWLNHNPVSDLSPLRGMKIEKLNLFGTNVTDISVVQSLPLNTLWLRDTGVEDFSPLRGTWLESLDVENTKFRDLKILKGMPLQRLNIAGTDVTDLTPLAEFSLTRLIFTPRRIEKGIDVLRNMSTIRELDVTFREPTRLTPAEFWKKFDAGEIE